MGDSFACGDDEMELVREWCVSDERFRTKVAGEGVGQIGRGLQRCMVGTGRLDTNKYWHD